MGYLRLLGESVQMERQDLKDFCFMDVTLLRMENNMVHPQVIKTGKKMDVLKIIWHIGLYLEC